MMTLTVLMPTTEILIGPGFEIPAVIKSVYVDSDMKISYEVIWWDGRTRKVEYLREFEVKVKPTNASFVKLGFAQ